MSEQLKPCPFCGSDEIAPQRSKLTAALFFACDECSTTGPAAGTKRGAIAKWNHRAEEPAEAHSTAMFPAKAGRAKRCPCGGTPYIDSRPGKTYVACRACGRQGPEVLWLQRPGSCWRVYFNDAGARDAWNQQIATEPAKEKANG